MPHAAGGKSPDQSQAVLREQYASLARQVPLMYALMFLNVLFLALVTADGGSWRVSFTAPLVLIMIVAVRGAAWYMRRGRETSGEDIRRYLRGTIIRAGAVTFCTRSALRSQLRVKLRYQLMPPSQPLFSKAAV